MIRITLSPADLADVQRHRYYHPQPHIMMRMHTLALSHEGESAPRIAQLLHRDVQTIRTCLHTYLEGGLKAVYEYEKHKKECELDGYSELIEQELDKRPPQSTKEAGATIHRLTGIKRSLTQIRAFLKKKNIVV